MRGVTLLLLLGCNRCNQDLFEVADNAKSKYGCLTTEQAADVLRIKTRTGARLNGTGSGCGEKDILKLYTYCETDGKPRIQLNPPSGLCGIPGDIGVTASKVCVTRTPDDELYLSARADDLGFVLSLTEGPEVLEGQVYVLREGSSSLWGAFEPDVTKVTLYDFERDTEYGVETEQCRN